jgi:hypothetical protein
MARLSRQVVHQISRRLSTWTDCLVLTHRSPLVRFPWSRLRREQAIHPILTVERTIDLVDHLVSWPQSVAQYNRNASKNLGAGRTAGEPLEAGGTGTAAAFGAARRVDTGGITGSEAGAAGALTDVS